MLTLVLTALLCPQATDAEAKEALAQFKESFRTVSVADRTKAVADLSKTPHRKTMTVLFQLLTRDHPKVRIQAVSGLATLTDHRKNVVPPLTRALTSRANVKEHGVRAAILKALGEFGDPKTLRILHVHLKDKSFVVVQAATRACAKIRNAGSVSPLIDALKRMDRLYKTAENQIDVGAVSGTTGLPDGQGVIVTTGADLRKGAQVTIPVVREALQGITGEKFETPKQWASWWGRAKSSFKVSP